MASTVGRLSPVPSPRGARPASLAFENDLSSAYTLRVSKRTGDDSSTFSTIAPGENWAIGRSREGDSHRSRDPQRVEVSRKGIPPAGGRALVKNTGGGKAYVNPLLCFSLPDSLVI
eukprot:1391183-Amorphochlora_amoeboformis.AAC.1